MSRRRFLVSVFVLAWSLTLGPLAGPGSGGTIPPGSNGTGVAIQVEANWSAGEDYLCSRSGNKINVFVNPGPPTEGGAPADQCSRRLLTLTFNVTGGPNVNTTSVPHDYDYLVTCDARTSQLRHAIAFDEDVGEPSTFTPIDSGVFTLLLANGDQLTIETTEGWLNPFDHQAGSAIVDTGVPALGAWGGLIVGAAVAGLGVLLIWRRRAASTT